MEDSSQSWEVGDGLLRTNCAFQFSIRDVKTIGKLGKIRMVEFGSLGGLEPSGLFIRRN